MSLCPKPGHTVLAGEQARPGVAVQQNWRATSRQPIEVIVEKERNWNAGPFLCRLQNLSLSVSSLTDIFLPFSYYYNRSIVLRKVHCCW